MENLNSRPAQVTAAVCMSMVFMCAGVPLWWKTTEVYRAELPYNEIQELVQSPKLALLTKVEVHATSEKLLTLCEEVITSHHFDIELNFIRNTFSFQVAANPISHEDAGNIERQTAAKTDVLLLLTDNAPVKKITVLQNRVIKIDLLNSDTRKGLEETILSVMNVLRDDIMHVQYINDAVGKAFAVKMDIPKDREYHMRKTVQPDKGYDLLFSLICPKPGELQASWRIHDAMKVYLYPMLAKLGNFSRFHVESQILHYCDMPVRPRVFSDGHILKASQLPHVVNPIESRLGAEISANPTLNFVVYLVEDRFNPLYIERHDGNISSTNTILIPRWGAIMMKNTNKTSGDKPRKLELDGKEFMEVFLAQLRSLLGLETSSRPDVTFEQSSTEAITDFELDYLTRSRIAENIASSVHTIHSLAKLLEKIQNIVIKDEIAELCYDAVNQIKLAKIGLENGELNEALVFSNDAFQASETAFFDPTLLELLYFPEDQKFAIYIPLFLPISLPLITSLFNAIKIWKSQKKQKLE